MASQILGFKFNYPDTHPSKEEKAEISFYKKNYPADVRLLNTVVQEFSIFEPLFKTRLKRIEARLIAKATQLLIENPNAYLIIVTGHVHAYEITNRLEEAGYPSISVDLTAGTDSTSLDQKVKTVMQYCAKSIERCPPYLKMAGEMNGASHCLTDELYDPKSCDTFLHDSSVLYDEVHKLRGQATKMPNVGAGKMPKTITEFFLPTKTVNYLKEKMKLINDEPQCSPENTSACTL